MLLYTFAQHTGLYNCKEEILMYVNYTSKAPPPPNISEHIVLADSVTMSNNLILKLNQSSTDFSVSLSSKSTYISHSYWAIKPEFAFNFSLIL